MDAAEGKPKGKAATTEANVGDSTTAADKVVMDNQSLKLYTYFTFLKNILVKSLKIQ